MQARRRLPFSWTAGVSRPLTTWRNSVPWHLSLDMPILLSHSSFILILVSLVWGAVLYQTQEDGTKAVIAYASRSLGKAESHYPAHKLEFLALKWAVVEKFHEYLYGSTFDVHTDNNPYVLATAKWDAASHHWVASLANYNFRLHYRAGKANIDADALLRVSWPGCMPDSSGTHLKVTVAAV